MNIKKKDILIVLGLFAIILWAGILNFRIDGDIMWHYKTGEFIVQNQAIPTTDIFSWQQNLNWMCHEWLYDICLYLAYYNIGAFAVRTLLTLVISLPIIVSYIYNRRRINNPYLFLAFISFILTFWNSSSCARPSEFSIVFMLLSAIYIVENKKYKNLVFMISCILTANIHGGSIAQLLVLPVLCMISDFVAALIVKNKIRFKEHIITFLFGFLGTLINPYGINIYKYTTNIFFGADFINSHIQEWQSNTISVSTAVFLVGLVLVLGASQEFRLFKKIDLRKYIIMIGFLCQGLDTRRMMFNASCVLMLFSYPYLEEFFSGRLMKNIKFFVPKIFIPLMSLLVITLLYGSFGTYERGEYIELVESKYEELTEAMHYIQENQLADKKIFANYNLGGNLILHDIKTFVDPRCDPFMEDFSDSTSLFDYFTYFDANDTTQYEAWEKLNDKYDFDYILLDLENHYDRELNQLFKYNNYKILYENEKSIIYSSEN
ncbi:hypothetical protein [Hungatella hathewayi]|uniref:hypothetical protein n=1 Tax=Hungatella hathewayi TaxID=154046 RepID=UPI00356AB1EA